MEYSLYISERRRLETALSNLKGKAQRVRKAPKRMGISEARLHKRRATEVQEKLNKSVKGNTEPSGKAGSQGKAQRVGPY